VTAEPAYDREFFTAPQQANQRRYEALRAYFVDQVSVAQAGERAGYTRSTMATLLRDFRAGRVELFAPSGRPGPKSAPAKDRARARVIELRRQGLSTYETSARLRAEGTPLNRTGVGQILTGEGSGRLLRGPGPVTSASPATAGRGTALPRADVIDFAALPARADTQLAGLLLVIPGLVAPGLPSLVSAAGYPGTRAIPPGQPDPVPARPQAHRYPPRLPRRRPAVRRRQRPVRRTAGAPGEVRPHRLLLPALP